MTFLSALCGALVAGGLVLAIAAFRAPQERLIRPPSRFVVWVSRLWAPQNRRRSLLGLLAGLAVLAFTGWPVAAIATMAAVIAAPVITSQRPAKESIAKLEALEQWTRKLSDLLGASRGLEDALALSVRKAPPPIHAEVEALARRLRSRSVHMSTGLALRLWADDLSDPVADRIAGALILAAEQRGSGVRRVLVQLAELVAKDVAARREIEASRAEHRTTIKWVLGFAIGYTFFTSLQTEYSAPFGTPVGQLAMAGIVGIYAGGLAWIHKLANPARQPRLLRPVSEQVSP